MNASRNAAERPFSEVLTSIFGNLQEIVRSEIRLAKTEVREDLAEAKRGLGWLGTGILCAFFAIAFLLGAIFLGLTYVVAPWAAALVVAGGLGLVSAVTLRVRTGKLRSLKQMEKDQANIESKENVAWARQPTK